MEYTRDIDRFAMPLTPASTRLYSYQADAEDNSQVSWYAPSVALSNISGASTSSSRKKSLVEDPLYRQKNLAENNIYIHSFCKEFPEDITRLVDLVRKDRDMPGPSPDQLRQDTDLEYLEMGTGEPNVEEYFHTYVFPKPKPSDTLQHTNRNPMAKHAVLDVGSKLKVSTLVLDMLYGYNNIGAFPQQQTQLRSIGTKIVANSQGLIYPFFVIEFKADGPGRAGSLWVATNQCLGGSASCVNIAERLNRQLRQCKSDKVQPIDSAAFSIAMSGTEARLYISWKHNDLDYYMRKVKSFSLQEPEQYVEFRKHVRNIIDWGKDKRLKEIRKSLDSLLEENRKIASQLAKSRPPPSDDSASSSSHKRKDREYRDQFIPAANERARSMNAEPSPLDSSNYNRVSDTDAYPAEESQTSVDEPDASFSYPVEAPDDEFANSFSYPAATSFSYSESDYNDLAEDPGASADEVPTYMGSTRSKECPSKESKKAVAKASRHSTSTSRQKHRSKK